MKVVAATSSLQLWILVHFVWNQEKYFSNFFTHSNCKEVITGPSILLAIGVLSKECLSDLFEGTEGAWF